MSSEPISHRTRAAAERDDFASSGAPALSRLSIHQTTTVRWSLAEAVAGYEAAGVAGIGVSLQKLDECGEPQGVRLLNASPLHVSSLGWVGGFTGDQGQPFREAVRDGCKAVRIAEAVGAESLILIAGALGRHIDSHARRLLRDGIRELAAFARARGVRLALQPMHPLFRREWSFLCGLDDALDLLSEFPPEQVGLAFGTYHLWQEERLLERIPALIPRLALVQLSDWREPPRCDNDRLLPGDGCIPVREIVAELERCGYDGWYEIEVWSRDLWKRDPAGLIGAAVERYRDLSRSRGR